ncbi:hypothetical protein [Kribbella sp. ALI-6-A]|uniref:hypothetical protein n=1 Tax=Kribbella sp. ALI-6-A TaxID=1933817 RepID=UPI001EDB4A0B|nr:hypothetical protein [Kribbella sp. ALI-6-A]
MSSRRFRLMRYEDVSGVSGTGPVAEGVQFTDGAVALRWFGDYPTTTVWDGIDSVIAIHGHGGATEVEWLDPDPGPDPKVPRREDLPPQPWPELHPAPEAVDEGPGPSLSGRHSRGDSAGDAPAPDGVERPPGTAPNSKATAPIFPAEHGSAGPIFPAERSGFSQHKGLFSEFMEPASRTHRRTGFTDLI